MTRSTLTLSSKRRGFCMRGRVHPGGQVKWKKSRGGETMRSYYPALAALMLVATACQGGAQPVVPVSTTAARGFETPTLLPATSSPSQTSAPAETNTPTALSAGLIRVDTLEQEVYPFVENGKC